MKRWRLMGVIQLFSLMVAMAGCGERPPQESMAREVELLEPVGLTSSGEAAVRRNLYDTNIFSAVVVPYVEEYGFDEDVTLKEFAAYPGQAVKTGEALALSDTEKVDEQIKEQMERIQNMEKEFAEYTLQVNEDLEKPQGEVKQLADILKNLEKVKPAEYLAVPDAPEEGEKPGTVSGPDADTDQEPDGDPEEKEPQINPAYQEWEQEYHYWEGRYRITEHSVNTALLQLEQRTALYELDHAYALQQLEFLRDKKSNITVSSQMAGNVVAIASEVYGGDTVWEETPIVAVGDTQRKELKCDYINRKMAAEAQEIYAVIDGVHYEVEYVPMDTEEYTRLKAQGVTAYSTLYFKGETPDVGMGDYAAVVVVSKKREQALSVPAEAVHKDDSGSYVYVVNGDENVYTSVSTGMSDGVYTEILSGISEGDVVRLDQGRQYSDQRVTVERGNFYTDFSQVGYMVYPSRNSQRNLIKYGTVYFQEYKTGLYQHVEKGDVIATVRVVVDEIELQRLTLELQRQQERLQDLIDQGREENKKAIESRQEEIAKLQEKILEFTQDCQTTAIRAQNSGIVASIDLSLEKEDILPLNRWLLDIADENTCYVVIDNEDGLLSYGNQVQVSYLDSQEQQKETMGMVANLNDRALSFQIKQENAFILLPSDIIDDMSVGTSGYGGWWNMARYGVEARLREMDNVLIVPRRAVRESEGCTYVNVVEPDGSIVRRSFIAGGFDKSNFWVVEGLTEGMELCLE